MIHQSVTPFGARPVSACLMHSQHLAAAPSDTPEIDKWAIFHALRKARGQFDLSNRDLMVLNALLTFHPSAKLIDGGQLVVFPSNASLSDRAHGMAESTLRRHLAKLVTAGVIARNDSPNGKRYAARTRKGAVVQAYGFDLRPLLVQAGKILALAEAEDEALLALKLARQAVVTRLRDVNKLAAYASEIGLTLNIPSAILNEIRAALRRKTSVDALEKMTLELGDILVGIQAKLPRITEELSGCDTQNERHQQSSHKEYFESEPAGDKTEPRKKLDDQLNLGMVLNACPDIKPYAEGKIRTWRDLAITADVLYPMMGISKDAWNSAKKQMGPERASGVLAAMLQRIENIHLPGGYLRKLTKLHCVGKFSLGQMIMALLNRPSPQAV